jgi:hypothetical protein
MPHLPQYEEAGKSQLRSSSSPSLAQTALQPPSISLDSRTSMPLTKFRAERNTATAPIVTNNGMKEQGGKYSHMKSWLLHILWP